MEYASFKYLKAFFRTFDVFTRETSIAGYRYLSRKRFSERCLWWMIHICHLSSVIYLSIWIFNDYIKVPTAISPSPYSYPVTEVPFPAVAICNINRITKSKAIKLANFLSNVSSKPQDEIMENIRLLGALYDFDINSADISKFVFFENLLETFDPDKDENLNMYGLLRRLIIDCPEMLSDCYWNGKQKDCNDMFTRALTMEGPCCIFNYLAIVQTKTFTKMQVDNHFRPLRIEDFENNGLEVKITSNTSDYNYKILATTGFKIVVGNPETYIDVHSGGVREALASVGARVRLKVQPVILETSENLKIFSPQTRNCYFPDEKKTIFGAYNFNNCIAECKAYSIVALCNCVPFQLSLFLTNNSELDQCTLNDLPCLNKHRVKWSTIYPYSYDGHLLEREKQDALKCECLPSCSTVTYDLKSGSTPIIDDINDELEINYTKLEVAFVDRFGFLLQQENVWYWYDMIGFFGGLCSLIMGLSFLGIFEVFFHYVSRFYWNLMEIDAIQPHKLQQFK